MAKKPTNRLDSLWPTENGDGGREPATLTMHHQFAEKIEPLVRNVGAAIAAYPRTSLTVATTLGAMLGWFIKRK